MLKVIVFTMALCATAQAAMIAGGWSTGNIAEVSELALWATKQMPTLAGLEGDYTIMTPRNVLKQVVNGINYKFTLDVVHRDLEGTYRFKSCEIHIYDQPWTNTRTFAQAPVCGANPVARAGQWTQVPAITDDILEVARLTGKQLTVGFQGEHNLAKVYNVEKQVVNGINYKFTVEYLVAGADNKYQSKVCDIVINHQSWNNNQITFLQTPVCQQNPQFPYVAAKEAGSWQDAPINEVAEISRWSASQLSAFTGIKGEHTVMTPRNVQKQIVAGVNYKFTLDVVAQDEETNKYFFKSCELFVFDQPWTNTRKFVEEPKCGAHPNFQ